jgi:hypothetical protein
MTKKTCCTILDKGRKGFKERILMYFYIDRVIQEEGLYYVSNMHSIVDNYFSISIVPVRSRGESLVQNKIKEFSPFINMIRY